MKGRRFRSVTPVLRAHELITPLGGQAQFATIRRIPIRYSAAPDPAAPGDDAAVSTRHGVGTRIGRSGVGRVLAGLALLALATAVALLFAAAAQKNGQITELHHEGVDVDITVTGCLGQIGGSGSNPVGYTCSGSFTLGGHRYTERIPGDVLRRPGSSLAGVAVPGDPALVTTAAALDGEHASARVYLLPSVLAVVLVAALVVVIAMLRRRRSATEQMPGP